MHCPIYNATMRSALCLEYQARARGESLPKKSIYSHPSDGSVLWAIKYKPCLTCEVGKKVKKNGGDDSDVEEKIAQANGQAARQLKRCSTCKIEKPVADFGRNRSTKDGLSLNCRDCKREQQKKSYQKLKGINMTANMTPDIDQIAPNIAPKAIKAQSISRNAQALQPVTIDYIADKSNIMADIPAEIINVTPDVTNVMSNVTSGHRTCRRCGHQGPDSDFYKTGIQGYTTVCKKCAHEKRTKTIREQAASGLTPQPKLPAHCVLLDFYEFPELLEELRSSAKTNFRTLANEIMFRVVNVAVNQIR